MFRNIFNLLVIIQAAVNSTDDRGWEAIRDSEADLDNHDHAGYRTPDSNENYKGQVNCRAIAAHRLQNASQARLNSVAIAVGRLPPDLHCWSRIFYHVFISTPRI